MRRRVKMRLKDKVAIITGGGSTPKGIGRVSAITFAREGAIVVVHDIDPVGAKATTEEIIAIGGRAISVQGDVSKRADMDALAKLTVDKFGKIDILAHIAGITEPKKIIEMTNEQWERIMAVDLEGTFNIIRAVLPYMYEKRYGYITAIASEVGKRGGGLFGGAHYAAAKAGVLGFRTCPQ
jgi:NAD(P)-dependent dehydrogenase (short-subunit alcohol dehydrogenase family)